MKEILIGYWMGRGTCDEDVVGLEHNSKYPYSKRELNRLVHKVLDTGLNVMIQNVVDGYILWIDDRKFTQR